MNCLLIETKDKRKFLTHEKNFIQLIEFSKTFNAEISIVKLEEGSVLELEELAPAICDPSYKKNKIKYEVIETKMSKEGKSRPEILKIADKVKFYIQNQFQNGKTVSLKELKTKFKKHKLSDATLCNHVRRVKQDLENKGFIFAKIGAGTYKAK
jgi:hypothetical protein